MSLIPVKDHKGLFRDSHSQAIINKNNHDFQAYIANSKKLLSDKERISSLEDELHDLKSMIQTLLDK